MNLFKWFSSKPELMDSEEFNEGVAWVQRSRNALLEHGSDASNLANSVEPLILAFENGGQYDPEFIAGARFELLNNTNTIPGDDEPSSGIEFDHKTGYLTINHNR